MPELPMLPREPTCPAALSIAGACGSQQGVVCRVMQRDVEDDPGLGMDAGRFGYMQHEADGGVYLNLKSDPSSVSGFCHGDALPVLHDEESSRASYTACPVWEAEKDRIRAARGDLFEPVEPEPVAMGVSSIEEIDPWQAAREGLDTLAPRGGV